MKIYICPECGWLRVVSRRKDVECHKCGNEQMKLTNLEFTKYSGMNEKTILTHGCIFIVGKSNGYGGFYRGTENY